MRRAVLTLGGTAAGLAALLSFKTHSPAADAAMGGTPGTSAPPSASASMSMSGGSTSGASTSGGAPAVAAAGSGNATAKASAGAGAGTASGKASATSKAKASAGSSTATRTVTGAVANTQYGPMQVRVTLAGQRITQVTVVQQTDDGTMSQQIDSFAIPKLTSETLAAQSARIDAVSGASYTSSGYIQSLQSALDQAGA